VVHSDCSSVAFFTMPSRLPAAILPLHCTRAPLASYRSSTLGKPWLPAAPCFVLGVFQKLFSSISSVYYVYCYVASICFCLHQILQRYTGNPRFREASEDHVAHGVGPWITRPVKLESAGQPMMSAELTLENWTRSAWMNRIRKS
jgi:hypothetical protein